LKSEGGCPRISLAILIAYERSMNQRRVGTWCAYMDEQKGIQAFGTR
jgi:hypothetical protein